MKSEEYRDGFEDALKAAARLVLNDISTTHDGRETPYIAQYNEEIRKQAAAILALEPNSYYFTSLSK